MMKRSQAAVRNLHTRKNLTKDHSRIYLIRRIPTKGTPARGIHMEGRSSGILIRGTHLEHHRNGGRTSGTLIRGIHMEGRRGTLIRGIHTQRDRRGIHMEDRREIPIREIHMAGRRGTLILNGFTRKKASL
uniref:hypothetical protein n=1 Tax=Eisenbergiella sp. TaxID=1924109 RepID=UPI003AB391D9